MKNKIMKLLEKYGEMQANLLSDALREKMADDIIKIVEATDTSKTNRQQAMGDNVIWNLMQWKY